MSSPQERYSTNTSEELYISIFHKHTLAVISTLDAIIRHIEDSQYFSHVLYDVNSIHLELDDIHKSLFKDMRLMIDRCLEKVLLGLYTGSTQLAVQKFLSEVFSKVSFCID